MPSQIFKSLPTRQELKIYLALTKRPWYSYSPKLVAETCGIKTWKELFDTCKSLSDKLIGDHVNYFNYNGVDYLGLQSRKLDYYRDAKNGVNPVEKLIKLGHYA